MTSEFERVANPFGSGAADFARIFDNTMQAASLTAEHWPSSLVFQPSAPIAIAIAGSGVHVKWQPSLPVSKDSS